MPVTDASPTGTRELFVEIVHEELPARMVDAARDALRDGVLGLLEGVRHGEVRTWS